MKFIHTSDLHIGKRVNGFSMIEDQKYILDKITDTACEENVHALIIAGDIYDRPVPSVEAVRLFDEFAVGLAEKGIEVIAVSGNHDSPDRLAFAGRLLEREKLHIGAVYEGEVKKVVLEDSSGRVAFHMLPFIKPADMAGYCGGERPAGYTEAVEAALSTCVPEEGPGARNVLVCHQFVTGAVTGGSEDITAGGIDNVDGHIFEDFDYVALGHIHRAQKVLRNEMRYSGTPLKYSLSEADHRKSVVLVEITPDNVKTDLIPVKPLRDMRRIRGTYEELTLRDNYEGTARDDYIGAVLTDEDDVPDALARLRVVYPNIMKLEYDNLRTRSAVETDGPDDDMRSEMDYFMELYEKQNGAEMTDEQKKFAEKIMEKLREDR